MGKKPGKNPSASVPDLRRRAEARLGRGAAEADADTQKLLHELQIHQIELELQNAELLEARAELEAGLQRYTDLYDFAPIAYFTLEPDGKIVQTNLVGAALLGKERGKVTGSHFGNFLIRGYRTLFADFLLKVFASQQHERCELQLLTADSHPCFVRLDACVDPLGKTCRAAGTDITEQKRVDQELRIAASLFDTMEEAVLIVDADNRILAVNPAFTRSTGYTAEEVLGRDPKLLKSGRHSALFYHGLWEALLATGHWEGEITNRRKNGEEYPEWLSIHNLYDEHRQVVRRIGVFSDISEQKRMAARVWHHANYDALTALPNRRLFQDRLQQDIERTRRSGRALALLFIDLDRFKEVNDTLGHATGDRLLAEAAKRICGCVRGSDTVARLGGDEFTVILSDLDATERVGDVSQRILDALTVPFRFDQDTVYLSASIGITLYPDDGKAMEELLKHADQAMYAAKSLGRNRFNYFTAEMQTVTLARLQLIRELRSALENKQFEVYFQPIVDLATGRIVKAEALLRWHHPSRGLVHPEEFIPVAEDSGLINEIGDWVFRQAAQWVSRRQLENPGAFQVSVNNSPIQFLGGRMQETWVDWLQKIGLSGESMVIEVTEGVLLSDRPEVIEKLRKLQQKGIRLAIDDFGTGYSALCYLTKFDVDYLKIDRVFIRKLLTDLHNQALVEAIIVMAHKLGIRVIAEGVETAEQRDWLVARGCNYAQGFLFASPEPAEQIDW